MDCTNSVFSGFKFKEVMIHGVVGLCLIVWGGDTWAQSSSSSSRSNSSGQSSFSSSTSSRSGGTSSSSSLNTSASGASSGGGLNTPAISTELGELSSSFDNSTYVGNSDNSGRFVGNTSSDLNQASQTSNRASSLKNLKSSGTGNTMTPTATESLLFKPRMHVSFSYQAKPNPQMSMVMTQKLALKNQLKGVQVDSNYDGAMVLKGTVASQEHKDLAEMYLRLEPGVEKVVNNISIAPALEAPTR